MSGPTRHPPAIPGTQPCRVRPDGRPPYPGPSLTPATPATAPGPAAAFVVGSVLRCVGLRCVGLAAAGLAVCCRGLRCAGSPWGGCGAGRGCPFLPAVPGVRPSPAAGLVWSGAARFCPPRPGSGLTPAVSATASGRACVLVGCCGSARFGAGLGRVCSQQPQSCRGLGSRGGQVVCVRVCRPVGGPGRPGCVASSAGSPPGPEPGRLRLPAGFFLIIFIFSVLLAFAFACRWLLPSRDSCSSSPQLSCLPAPETLARLLPRLLLLPSLRLSFLPAPHDSRLPRSPRSPARALAFACRWLLPSRDFCLPRSSLARPLPRLSPLLFLPLSPSPSPFPRNSRSLFLSPPILAFFLLLPAPCLLLSASFLLPFAVLADRLPPARLVHCRFACPPVRPRICPHL